MEQQKVILTIKLNKQSPKLLVVDFQGQRPLKYRTFQLLISGVPRKWQPCHDLWF